MLAIGNFARRHAVSALQTTSAGTMSSFLWFSSAPASDFKTGSKEEVETFIAAHDLVVFSKSYCPFCKRAKNLLDSELKVPYTAIELDKLNNGDAIQDTLLQISGQRSVPNVFVGGEHVGGCDDTFAEFESGALQARLKKLNL